MKHTGKRARLVLVDDHPLVRDGLRARLEAVTGFEVAGEAGNADEALALAAAVEPDLVLMDVGMAGMNGIALAGIFHDRFRPHRRRCRRVDERPRVPVLSPL